MDISQTPPSKWRQYAKRIVEHKAFTPIIIAFILFNAVIVGLETYPNLYDGNENVFFTLDRVLLWIFTVEIALRLAGTHPVSSFFKNGWNWFDFVIVLAGHIFVGGHFVTVLRILRVLRVLRAVTVIPSLRRLVDALMRTIPAMGNIMVLMFLVFYIFAVIGTILYADISPEYFGSLQATMITLFQVVTLESWAEEVMRPVLAIDPWAWFYFVAFILVGTFVIFNLFIGVIVNNVEKANEADQDNEEDGADPLIPDTNTKELQQLREEVSELKEMLRSMQHNDKT
ncbi:voltage-gated sodium channel [Salsuginibacillus halophilus]|uniref:Voltage-gated sodium channel n=1 Tax=Salsuginibacillus halophilus TaxID=517424 RepID=A0A2P8HX34_9BACI|nr:ion transporter [Salsuginibacillus halophilus]PSL50801.1 voltage-gated sodium channel [Salsuginibacillus halophilus]